MALVCPIRFPTPGRLHRWNRSAVCESNLAARRPRRRNIQRRLSRGFQSDRQQRPTSRRRSDRSNQWSLGGLTAAEVLQILNNAEATANTTRAAIRLPLGSRAKMVIAVADLDGTLIGLRRMVDSHRLQH